MLKRTTFRPFLLIAIALATVLAGCQAPNGASSSRSSAPAGIRGDITGGGGGGY